MLKEKLQRLVCRLFGHRPFQCHICDLNALGAFYGLGRRTECPGDRHNTCGRCSENLPVEAIG
jgi:hypothetical protein